MLIQGCFQSGVAKAEGRCSDCPLGENVHGTCMVDVAMHGDFVLIPHMGCDFLLLSVFSYGAEIMATRRMRNSSHPRDWRLIRRTDQ